MKETMKNLRNSRISVPGVLLPIIALALFSGCANAQAVVPEPERPAMPEKPVTPKLDDVIVTDKKTEKLFL